MKIGVIIPTCNRPLLLPRAVSSVLRQTLSPCEVIVVNDGWEPVILSGDRIKNIKTDGPRGLPAARAAGINALQNSIDAVAYVDDDDEMLQDHLRLLADQISSGKHFAFSMGLHKYPDGSTTTDPEPGNKGPKRYYDPTALLVQNIAPPSCFMHTMKAYQEVGGWDEECLRIEDWDLWGRMFIRYGPPGFVNQATTVIYKGHGTNLTDSNQFNYSMACSWRDVVDDRLKHMASEKRCKISAEDRLRFHVPKIGIPLVNPSDETLNSIIKQDADFEVLLVANSEPRVKDPRIRFFPSPAKSWEEMMNWGLLVSRSEYLAFVDRPLQPGALAQRTTHLDAARRTGILAGDPVMMRRRVVETIGGLTSDLPDLVRRASERFEVKHV